ncbi:MAG: DUF5689 domain-containing protein [Odoribacter sp.]|nr:DUF5689 domain-containing protein [Odoribacter sp.]
MKLQILSEIGNYENTLVTLKNVEFAIPMGTYVNINEDSYNEEGNATSINLGDTPREYAHILRDKAGNFVRLYSASTFTDRFKGLIPQGSGDITGIVMKKNKNGEIINTLRIRSHADNNVSNSVKDRLTNTIVQFGPFDDVSDKSTVTANIGTGTIKTSMFSNILNTSGSTAMYWAWTYARRITADLDANGNASPALTTNIQEQYACLNTQQWWNGTGTSILDQSGEAWIITFSTEDAQGDLLLSFTTSSSQTGPRYFTIEWADSENTAAANWQAITEYESTDWNSNYQLLQHQYRLPDAIKGKQSVVIRMRVNQNVRVNGNTSTIASGGTNRIGYWSVTEKKY